MAALAQRAASDIRADLHRRLQARRPEIERALLAKVFALAEPIEALDPHYREGLRSASLAALEFWVASVGHDGEGALPVPPPLLTQARLGARKGIGLGAVLRRYFAGYALLGDFLTGEAEDRGLLGEEAMRALLRDQAALFDRILAAVSEEYGLEEQKLSTSVEGRRAEHVEALLAGEQLGTSQLSYDFDSHHVGLIASGPGAAEAIRRLAARLDCRLLSVNREDGEVWAWLCSRRQKGFRDLCSLLDRWPSEIPLAVGEPGHGPNGWRLTHNQAQAALPIALQSPGSPTRYAEVALPASMLKDDLLATSLQNLYLSPLAKDKDGGKCAVQTLSAYFAKGQNATSAAAALGVSRNTMTSRLRAIEASIGASLSSRASQLEAALRLQELHRKEDTPTYSSIC